MNCFLLEKKSKRHKALILLDSNCWLERKYVNSTNVPLSKMTPIAKILLVATENIEKNESRRR